ncbi:MAG: hypothetical protein JSU07_03100 [Bacteroidetes bacterium]|nr:hypothetical protein [Bacteroidota bacterium]
MRKLFIWIGVFAISSIFSQTKEESRQFFNKSNPVIYTAQKSILREGSGRFDNLYLDILKHQLKAKELFDAGNYAESLLYSNQARKLSFDVFSKTSTQNVDFYKNSFEENELLKKTNSNIQFNLNLNSSNTSELSKLDVKNPSSTYKLIPNIQ